MTTVGDASGLAYPSNTMARLAEKGFATKTLFAR